MSNKEKLLENLGLKSTAVQIYLYLLSAKKATILEVAKETGIARTNIYNNVTRLIQMGLIGEAIEGGKKYLVPESPNNLINFVKSKEAIAKEAAGLLQEDFLTNKYESKIRFGHGPEGFKKFADELINQCKDKQVRQIVSHKLLTEYSNQKFLKSHWNKRRNKNIYAKILIPSAEKNQTKQNFGTPININYLREIRYLPENLNFDISIMTYDDKVNIFAPSSEGYMFIFESRSFANSIKALFDFLWKTSDSI